MYWNIGVKIFFFGNLSLKGADKRLYSDTDNGTGGQDVRKEF